MATKKKVTAKKATPKIKAKVTIKTKASGKVVKKTAVKKTTPKRTLKSHPLEKKSVLKKVEKVIKNLNKEKIKTVKPKAVKPTGLAVGAEIEMAFYGAGVTSREKHIISNFDSKFIWISTENSKGDFYKFDRKTGKCLNDNTFGGFSRTILPQ